MTRYPHHSRSFSPAGMDQESWNTRDSRGFAGLLRYNIKVHTHVDDDPLAKVMIVRYGLEVRDSCVLGVGVRSILVLAAEFRQRSARIKVPTSLMVP